MSRYYPRDPEVHSRQRASLRRKIFWILLIVLVLLVVTAYGLLRWSGNWLVQASEFNHVQWVAVLDGQSADMERTDFAMQLLKQGKVDSILVLGRRVYRDQSNADFYLEDMLMQGRVDTSRIFLFRHDDPSTLEEARSILPMFQVRAADTVVIITRNAATRRVSAIFNQLSNGHPYFVVLGPNDPVYEPNTWLHSREARKVWLREWAAYIASKWDLLGEDPTTPDLRKVAPLEAAATGVLPQAPSLTPLANLAVSSSSENFELPEMSSAEVKPEVAPVVLTPSSSSTIPKVVAKPVIKPAKPKVKPQAKPKKSADKSKPQAKPSAKPKDKPRSSSSTKKTVTGSKSSSSRKVR